MRPVCGWEGLGAEGWAEDPGRKVQAPGQVPGAPEGQEVTSTPNDQAGCSVRPGVIYGWVWRCSPTSAPRGQTLCPWVVCSMHSRC